MGATPLLDAGVGAGDRVGVRMPSGTRRAVRRDPGGAGRRRRLRPGRRRRPGRARRAGVRRGPGAAIVTDDGIGPGTAPVRADPPLRGPGPSDDAWIIFTSGSTGTPKGVAVTPPLRGRVRRRRGAAVPARTSRSGRATGCWPACRSRSTRRARRCGWRGGTAPAWCPAPRSLVRSRHGPRAVAGRAAHHRRLHRARRWPRCGRPRRSKRSGC